MIPKTQDPDTDLKSVEQEPTGRPSIEGMLFVNNALQIGRKTILTTSRLTKSVADEAIAAHRKRFEFHCAETED